MFLECSTHKQAYFAPPRHAKHLNTLRALKRRVWHRFSRTKSAPTSQLCMGRGFVRRTMRLAEWVCTHCSHTFVHIVLFHSKTCGSVAVVAFFQVACFSSHIPMCTNRFTDNHNNWLQWLCFVATLVYMLARDWVLTIFCSDTCFIGRGPQRSL